MQSCPAPSLLDELLQGDLEGERHRAVEGHLGACPLCQQTLLDLTGSPAEWDRWQRLLRTDTAHYPFPASGQPPAAASSLPEAVLDRMKSALETDVGVETNDGPPSWPQVPGFAILNELGRGGTAVVYLARQQRLGRRVALKMILAGKHAGPERQARFRQEARVVAQLHHPNIVQVFETGEHEGLPYFAMELVAGGTLGSRTRGVPQAPAATAALIATVARAVHTAHASRIVHRDLKPANILLQLEKDTENGPASVTLSSCQPFTLSAAVPKVTDFGLALLLDDDTTSTRTGDVLGTPSYMAPEQAQGRRDAVGPPTDVYALGAILYELLTGRPPFQAATAVDTLVRVSFEEPVPPTQLQPMLPRDLETICLKCLRKEPDRRYASALELALDLERFLGHQPIRARPVGSGERLRKWARRRPAIAAMLALVASVTVLAFTGISLALVEARTAQHNERRQRAAAEEATRTAHRALEEAEQGIYRGKVHQARAQWLLNNARTAQQLLESCAPRLRGWEWHYLHGLQHADLFTLATPDAPFVNAVAYSPDGCWLVVGGGNPFGAQQSGFLQVCDAVTGAVRWRQEGRPFPIWGVAVSPNGRFVASYGGDGRWYNDGVPRRVGELLLSDAATGKVCREFSQQSRSPGQSVAFSPDGQRLASASLDNAVRVWEVMSGDEVYALKLGNSARRAVFSPDGRYLLTGSDDGVRCWDATTGTPIRTLTNYGGLFTLSPDGRRLVTVSSQGGAARVFDVSDLAARPPQLVDALPGKASDLACLTFGPDGGSIAAAGADGTVRVWRVVAGTAPQAIFRGHLGRVAALAFHPDGHRLASAGQQPGEVKVWDMTRPTEHTVAVALGAERHDIDALTFTDGDAELLVLGVGGLLCRWDTATGRLANERRIGTEYHWLVPAVRSVFAARGQRLVAVSHEDMTRINVWDVAAARWLRSFAGHASRIWYLAADSAGNQIISVGLGSKDGKVVREIQGWESATGQVRWSETTVGQRTLALALSADGTRLAESVQTGTEAIVRLSDGGTAPGDAALVCQQAQAAVRALAFSRDGAQLAGATDRGAVVVWDARTGKHVHEQPLEGTPGLGDLAFSPDGTRLAGVDRTRVLVWDVRSGQVLLYLQGAAPRTGDNAFNPRIRWSEDGTRLAASNWDRSVSIWEAVASQANEGKDWLRQRAEQRRYGWHLDQLERHEPDLAAPPDEFHRRRVLEAEPPTIELRRRRGDYFARQRHWKKALADFAVPGEQAMDRLLAHALLLLQTGDRQGYERLVGQALAQAGDPREGQAAWEAMRVAALAPLPAALTTQALALVRQVRATHPQERTVLDYLGLALLRTGRAPEADACFRLSLKEYQTVLAEAGLALALLRQGNPQEARERLDKVERWLAEEEQQFPACQASAVAWEWQMWLLVSLLRQEAVGLLARSSGER